ncbi:hypothetical protein HN789_03365 [archaeon]|jgi:hypothetical protein|nr:hypothetical protein [archaeon]MBT4022640.1 hypothetical protein [archaeon]MBT4272080.1 hypothetical protein [archaeon]MBT4461177.1 hypothetical protein [archaeon]MBT4858700.1 hypothetical protein [archaeon]
MAKKSETKKQEVLEHKKEVLLKGIGLHLLTYLVICIILLLIGVPLYIAVMLFMVLIWGLFVLSYALVNKNK